MWLIIGIIIGAAVLGLIWLLTKNNFSLKWYEWLLIAIGIFLLVFTIQNFFGSFSEHETKAAWMFLLFTGLPAVLCLVIAWQLAAARNRSKNV